MKRIIGILILILACVWLLSCSRTEDSHSAAQGFDDYRVEVEHSGELILCQVTFEKTPPNSDVAANIVRTAVEELVEKSGTQEILAMAFNEAGDALPETHYGGALVYKPSDGQILTMDERNGQQATEGDEGAYYVRIEERRTAKGITPVREWLTVSIVFSSTPTGQQIREAVFAEVGDLKARDLDVKVYIFKGDKSNKVTWEQIQADNGKYMGVNYVHKTGNYEPNWNWD